jgi:hypothetical protein
VASSQTSVCPLDGAALETGLPCKPVTVAAPVEPLKSPPSVPPPCAAHWFVATHAYTFAPGGAVSRKNICDAAQVAGSEFPADIGLVEAAFEKSTLLLCVRRSTCV